MNSVRAAVKALGPKYVEDDFLTARRMTRRAIHDIAARITPGMVEEDAVRMARAVLKQAGLIRGWHGVYVRFGPNTIKTFGDASTPGIVLRQEDIFFVDIGPVWRNVEADGGETFVVGDNAEFRRAASDVRTPFGTVQSHWATTNASGAQLYAFADAQAEALGWRLNPDLSGHRLADFPYTVHYRGSLLDIDFHPSPKKWMLEIHIRHLTEPYGAFYEDLLPDAPDR